MRKKKSKTETILELFALSLLFIGLVSAVYSWMHGGLS